MTKARVLLSAVALSAVLGGAVAGPVTGDATHAKRVKCKHGRVLVKVNGKSRCKRLRDALPRPKRGDERLVLLRTFLKFDVSKLRGKHGRHPRSLQRNFGRAGKKAQRVVLATVPKMLARIDAKAHGPRHGPAVVAAAQGGCGGPSAIPPIGPPGQTGGAQFDGGVGPGGEEGGYVQYSTGDLTVRVTLEKCAHREGDLTCPEANGNADASDHEEYETSQRVYQGGKLVSSTTTRVTGDDKLHGSVADDARVDYFDLTHTQHELTVATGGVVDGARSVRKVRVNMRTGRYEPAHSSVTIDGDRDVFGESQFAARVARWISNYRYYEAGWTNFDSPHPCAKAVFSPASETRRLRKGQSGSVSMHAKAKDGTTATGARWNLLDPVNGTFSPQSARSAAPSVQYHVTAAPPNGHVRVTVKFTSTAGVGKASWSQPVQDVTTINKITGNFSGSYHYTTVAGDSITTWAGSATFKRSTANPYGGAWGTYSLLSGSYHITVSGIDGSFATACQQEGSKDVTMAGAAAGYVDVLGASLTAPFDPPYKYSVQVAPTGPQTLTITRVSCPPGAQSEEGTTGPSVYFPFGIQDGTEQHDSSDGVDYVGSVDQSAGGATLHEEWVFHGTP